MNVLILILHFVGDYLLQNDWMAKYKKQLTGKGYLACSCHVLCYSIPFLFVATPLQWLFIAGSHFVIDKFGLAEYWIRLINWNWSSKNFGFSDDKPSFLSIWLLIIVDNTFHIICNYLSFTFL